MFLVFCIFQSNRILKLEGLSSLVSLEELYLSHNGISEIEGLDKLVSLKNIRNLILWMCNQCSIVYTSFHK